MICATEMSALRRVGRVDGAKGWWRQHLLAAPPGEKAIAPPPQMATRLNPDFSICSEEA